MSEAPGCAFGHEVLSRLESIEGRLTRVLGEAALSVQKATKLHAKMRSLAAGRRCPTCGHKLYSRKGVKLEKSA